MLQKEEDAAKAKAKKNKKALAEAEAELDELNKTLRQEGLEAAADADLTSPGRFKDKDGDKCGAGLVCCSDHSSLNAPPPVQFGLEGGGAYDGYDEDGKCGPDMASCERLLNRSLTALNVPPARSVRPRRRRRLQRQRRRHVRVHRRSPPAHDGWRGRSRRRHGSHSLLTFCTLSRTITSRLERLPAQAERRTARFALDSLVSGYSVVTLLLGRSWRRVRRGWRRRRCRRRRRQGTEQFSHFLNAVPIF